jgi:hypothetical protein
LPTSRPSPQSIAIDIDRASEPFRAPLQRDAEAVAHALGRSGEPVMLSSIASPKYVDVLLSVFGERLLFPA